MLSTACCCACGSASLETRWPGSGRSTWTVPTYITTPWSSPTGRSCWSPACAKASTQPYCSCQRPRASPTQRRSRCAVLPSRDSRRCAQRSIALAFYGALLKARLLRPSRPAGSRPRHQTCLGRLCSLQLLKDWMAPVGRHRGHSAPLGSQGAGGLSGSAIRSCGVTGSFVLCDVLPRQFQQRTLSPCQHVAHRLCIPRTTARRADAACVAGVGDLMKRRSA
jgi:hypothetical protein